MIYDIIIIGAGTAGMSAAIYAKRAGKKILVLEGTSYGGQIVASSEVENYPGMKHVTGYEFAKSIYDHMMSFKTEIIYEQVLCVVKNENQYNTTFSVKTNKSEFSTKSVIIATGTKKRLLGMANEEKYIGHGISYCATCDGAFFKGKTVAVIGGGNTALEDALFLSKYCEKVYLVYRGSSFKGDKVLVKTIVNQININVLFNSVVNEIIGEDKLEGIMVRETITNGINKLQLSGLFVAIGQVPQNDAFKDIVNLDKSGYVIASESCDTSEEGIFAAGDCRTKRVRQLVTAASDGAISALAACNYIDINRE